MYNEFVNFSFLGGTTWKLGGDIIRTNGLIKFLILTLQDDYVDSSSPTLYIKWKKLNIVWAILGFFRDVWLDCGH